MNITLSRIILIGVLVILMRPAFAATYTLNLIVDLQDESSFDDHFLQTIAIDLPYLQTGDIVETTINFANGERIQLEKTLDYVPEPWDPPDFPPPSEQDFFFQYKPEVGNNAGLGRATSSVELLGLTGEYLEANPKTGIVSDCTYCYNAFLQGSMTDSIFSFSGVKITSLIELRSTPSVESDFTSFRISLHSSGYDEYAYSVVPSIVPIPAAVWLFGSALAGLGWVGRKQKV